MRRNAGCRKGFLPLGFMDEAPKAFAVPCGRCRGDPPRERDQEETAIDAFYGVIARGLTEGRAGRPAVSGRGCRVAPDRHRHERTHPRAGRAAEAAGRAGAGDARRSGRSVPEGVGLGLTGSTSSGRPWRSAWPCTACCSDAGHGRVRGERRRAERASRGGSSTRRCPTWSGHVPGPRPERRAAALSPPPARSRRTSRRWRSARRRGGIRRLGRRRGAAAVDGPGLARRPPRDRVAVPTAAMLGQTVSIKGNGAEHVGGVEGAVDRIAERDPPPAGEGADPGRLGVRRLGQPARPSASGWASTSTTVYAPHRASSTSKDLASDGGLLTSVVAFGKDRKAMTPEPTADTAAIVSAIDVGPARRRPASRSTFQTVAEIVRRWGQLQGRQGARLPHDDHRRDRRGRRRRAAARGGDRRRPPRPRCRSTSSARRRSSAGSRGYMDYTDPKTKQYLPQPPGPPGARERGARADPPAVLVRRPAVRHARRRASAPTP